MNSAVIRISTERIIEMASAKSSSSAGSGRIRTIRMVSTPTASARSPRLARSPKLPMPGREKPPDCAAVTSLMLEFAPQPRASSGARPLLGNYCRVYGYQKVNEGFCMQIAIVGLGRMGANIARRLMRHGHDCVVFDADLQASLTLGKEGATSAAALQDLVRRLKPPRVVWLMLPAGDVTANAVEELSKLLAADDVIIDGGNTFWKDDIARAKALQPRGIHYLDVGTSGGVWGLERGYCLMIGGEKDVVERLDPIFRTLAPGEGGISRTPGREKADPRV